MTDAQAAAFEAQGFEIALHPNTMCINQSLFSLQNTFTKELAKLAANFPSISAPVTCRKHCLAWGDWSSTPKAEMQNGSGLMLIIITGRAHGYKTDLVCLQVPVCLCDLPIRMEVLLITTSWLPK